MRRDDVLAWLIAKTISKRQGEVFPGMVVWLDKPVTHQKIAEDLGISIATVKRDLNKYTNEGVVNKKVCRYGVQLGLIQVAQNELPQAVPGSSKCPTSNPDAALKSIKNISTYQAVNKLTKKIIVNTVVGEVIGECEGKEGRLNASKTQVPPRQKIAWEDLVILADSPEGWEDLESVERYGFAKCVEERTNRAISHSRVFALKKQLAKKTLWPCAAIVCALTGYSGKDQGGRRISDPPSYILRKAYWLATEEHPKIRQVWEMAEDKRRAKARGPEAEAVQALIAGLGKAMNLPGGGK